MPHSLGTFCSYNCIAILFVILTLDLFILCTDPKASDSCNYSNYFSFFCISFYNSGSRPKRSYIDSPTIFLSILQIFQLIPSLLQQEPKTNITMLRHEFDVDPLSSLHLYASLASFANFTYFPRFNLKYLSAAMSKTLCSRF